MSTRSSLLPLIAVATMFQALAQNGPSPRVSTFPPVGLGSTETAEVSVVNLAADTSTTKASCSGTISFLNSSGTVIGAATPFTATAGQIVVVRLPFGNSGGPSPRAEIRAAVQLNATTTTPRPPCSAEFSMETYDTGTGATHTLQTMSVQELAFGFRN